MSPIFYSGQISAGQRFDMAVTRHSGPGYFFEPLTDVFWVIELLRLLESAVVAVTAAVSINVVPAFAVILTTTVLETLMQQAGSPLSLAISFSVSVRPVPCLRGLGQPHP